MDRLTSPAQQSDDEQHEQTSLTYSMQCSALRKNKYVMIKGRPCKITNMSPSKTGRIQYITAIDIFTGQKFEDSWPSTHNMDVPLVRRNEYSLRYVKDGFLHLMTGDGTEKNDVKLPEGELGQKIQEECKDDKELLITVVSAMGEEAAISYKEAPKGS